MNLSAFLSENAIPAESIKHVVSKRFVADGKPVEWTLQPISGAHDEELRRSCTKRVQTPGKKNLYQNEVDYNLYLAKLAVACIVYPNLSDAELQNSYHVKCAEDLLKTMLTPGEYVDCIAKVQEICGFDTLLDDEVEAAKNS